MKTDIKSMTPEELEAFCLSLDEKRFRAKQVFRWLYKGIYRFEEMTDISSSLQSKLEETAFIEALAPLKIQVSKQDKTRKYLFGLSEGQGVESVFMKYKYGNSVCISSQAGCRMGCSFCASGIGGLSRNLTAGEMVDQIIAIEKDTGEKVSNVVVMGTGEPFDNYDNLASFLTIIHQKDGLGLSWRSVTVSTCGLIPQIRRFGEEFPQVNLAISLHAPNDKIRDMLMPINKKYPMKELLETCRQHGDKTGRRVTFEYALIDGVNDGREHALMLAGRLAGMLCHVNLIPLNPVVERKWKGAARRKAEEFQAALEGKGIPTTLRRELGSDIDAACGQLRLSERKE